MIRIPKLKLSVAQVILLVVIGVVAVRSLLPFFHIGFPNTHDGEGHVARVANYAVAIRQGHIPPRIAPTFSNGYGYPIFNYFYPLLSMLGAPAVLVGLHPELVIKLVLMVVWVTLWIGIFLYIQQLVKSRMAALMGLLVFMMSPYIYSLMFVRGAYGELLAATAFVWVLYCIEKRAISEKSKIAFSIPTSILSGLLLLAHNIYAVLLFPAAGVYALLRNKKKEWKRIFIEFGIGFCLSAFFWVPVLLEKNYVVLDEKLSSFYDKHFISLQQLLSSQVTFGLSTTDMADTISYGVGLGSIVTFVLAVILMFKSVLKKKKIEKRSWVLLVLATALVFLMLPISLPIWKVSFILPYIQFPWRLLGPLGLVLAVLAAHVWASVSKTERAIIIIALLINAFYILGWHWPTYNHYDKEYYLNYRQSTTLLGEARPKVFTVDPSLLSLQTPQIFGEGQIEMGKWRGTYRYYTVDAQESVTIVEPTSYFLGWKVWANGKEIAVDKVIENQGQVAYTLPAGHWEIKSKITQLTIARIIGNTLTLVGVLLIGMLSMVSLKKYTLHKRHSKK